MRIRCSFSAQTHQSGLTEDQWDPRGGETQIYLLPYHPVSLCILLHTMSDVYIYVWLMLYNTERQNRQSAVVQEEQVIQ